MKSDKGSAENHAATAKDRSRRLVLRVVMPAVVQTRGCLPRNGSIEEASAQSSDALVRPDTRVTWDTAGACPPVAIAPPDVIAFSHTDLAIERVGSPERFQVLCGSRS